MTGSKKASTTKKETEQRSGRAMQPVSEAARPLIKKALPKTSAYFQQLFDVWGDLVTGTEAALSIPEKLTYTRDSQKDGVLHVWAKTGAQATEMSFNKAMILRKVNAYFGFNAVGDLRVTAYPSMNDNAGRKSVRIGKSAKGVSCQSLDKSLSDISNPALREVLAGLGGVLDPNSSENKDITGDTHA